MEVDIRGGEAATMVTGARGEGVKFGFAIKIIVESSIFGRELDLLFFSEEL